MSKFLSNDGRPSTSQVDGQGAWPGMDLPARSISRMSDASEEYEAAEFRSIAADWKVRAPGQNEELRAAWRCLTRVHDGFEMHTMVSEFQQRETRTGGYL